MKLSGTVSELSSGYYDDHNYVRNGKFYVEIALDENPGPILTKAVEITITDEPSQPMSLNVYRDQCGQAAEANGWHNKYQFAEAHVRAYGPRYEQALLDHIVAKTALIGCEVAEAIEEIRDGHEPCETYYGEGGKPEGYPSELADVIVRALDLAYMLGIDIEDAVQEKLAFNASRGQMHGGKKL